MESKIYFNLVLITVAMDSSFMKKKDSGAVRFSTDKPDTLHRIPSTNRKLNPYRSKSPVSPSTASLQNKSPRFSQK